VGTTTSKVKEAPTCTIAFTITPHVLYETAQESVLLCHAVLESDHLQNDLVVAALEGPQT
jgi:hypothetical protein